MAVSIWEIAELAWRQINPGGSDEAKNTLEEYVTTAKHELANIAYTNYMQGREEADLTLIEEFLSELQLPLKEDEKGLYVELDAEVLNLPHDLGIWQVKPLGRRAKPLTRGKAISHNLFEDDPGGTPVFYRKGRRIYLPDGTGCQGAREVVVTVATLEQAPDKMEVPDVYAKFLRDALIQRYGSTANIPVQDSNNQNPNT